MTTTGPSAQIKVKALGLQWRGKALLASEIRDSDGRLKGVRPLGGTFEVGETTTQALHREFQEELDEAITVTGPPIILENIFQHLGAPGHEIVFLYPLLSGPGPLRTPTSSNITKTTERPAQHGGSRLMIWTLMVDCRSIQTASKPA